MPAKVCLKIIKGNLTGKEYVYDQRTVCIIGRKRDCNIVLSSDDDHRRISRHHCLLDINPPDIRIRDFGSLNGTYVNGKKIGQRNKEHNHEEATRTCLPEYDLKNDDEFELGNTVFKVIISEPVYCIQCFVEIPEAKKSHLEYNTSSTGITYLCEKCREKPIAVNPKDKTQVSELSHQKERDSDETIIRTVKKIADVRGLKVIKELGQGGMGAVYLMRNTKTMNELALKVMLPQTASDNDTIEIFLREAENTRSLDHPNVVKMMDLGFAEGACYFTLEFCNDGNVKTLMKNNGGTLSLDEALNITLQALDGLHYAHSVEIPFVKLIDGGYAKGRGLVHRDIKPENILLNTYNGKYQVKVSDFGLSKAFDLAGLSGLTVSGKLGGTLSFMCREQLLNYRSAMPAVDIWSMAATLYNILTGYVPREFIPYDIDPITIILNNPAIPIRKRKSSIPHKLAEVIDAALIEEPKLIFTSALDFKKELENAL
ncbi:MAG: protein kinase [Nitrospirae bacterium]|nr:protein kinase [Nitrospirota bacterium]